MAALTLPTRATYEVHEQVSVDTADNADHTFCGIMFPVRCRSILPLEHIVIRSVAVRGGLGPLSVYVHRSTRHSQDTTDTQRREHVFPLTSPRHWTKVYEHTHEPSWHEYRVLPLEPPIILQPDQVCAIYVHSQAQGDDAIVYDNSGGFHGTQARHRHSDAMLTLYSGKAHVSPVPFGQTPIWGWGNAWRDRREFVGAVDYAARYRLWTPTVHQLQGPLFARAVEAMLSCQRRDESPVSRLPDECLYYIFNMCRWDWFGDTPQTMQLRRRQSRRKAQQRAVRQAEALREASVQEMAPNAPASEEHDKDRSCCQQQRACVESTRRSGTDRDGGNGQESESEDEFGSDEEMADHERNSDALDEDAADDEDVDDEEDDNDDDEEDDDGDEDFVDDSDHISTGSEESDWERAHGYRADNRVLRVVLSDSEEDSDDSDEEIQLDTDALGGRGGWFRRSLNRIHVLRAMAHRTQDDHDRHGEELDDEEMEVEF